MFNGFDLRMALTVKTSYFYPSATLETTPMCSFTVFLEPQSNIEIAFKVRLWSAQMENVSEISMKDFN